MISVIFFDLDDTLLDHSLAMRFAATALHANLGLDIAVDVFLSNWQTAIDRYYPQFVNGEISYEAARRARMRETVDSALTDAAADSLFALYLARYESAWVLFPDVLPCLNRLRSFRLGIITNGRSDEQRRKLARLGLTDRFEYVIISDEYGVAKPSSQIFRGACDAADVTPLQAIHIGDHYELDACGARTAGLNGIWLNRHGYAASNHRPPIMSCLDELNADVALL